MPQTGRRPPPRRPGSPKHPHRCGGLLALCRDFAAEAAWGRSLPEPIPGTLARPGGKGCIHWCDVSFFPPPFFCPLGYLQLYLSVYFLNEKSVQNFFKLNRIIVVFLTLEFDSRVSLYSRIHTTRKEVSLLNGHTYLWGPVARSFVLPQKMPIFGLFFPSQATFHLSFFLACILLVFS